MRFNSFLPVAAVTAVSATMLAVSAPAQAKVTGQIDLVGSGLVKYTNNSLGFSVNGPQTGAFGIANIVNSTPTLSSFYAANSQANIFDVMSFNTGGTPQMLLSNGSGVDFFYNKVSTGINTLAAEGKSFNFDGFFKGPGVAETKATFSILTAQGGPTGSSSYSMTIQAQAVPEPSAFGGLVAFGVLSAGLGLKRRQKQAV